MKFTRQHAQGAIAALVVIVALVGGSLAAHELFGAGAAITASSTSRVSLAQRNAEARVPFLGPYAQHVKGDAECGPGVKLMEQALRTAKARKSAAASCVGRATTLELIAFQKKHKIPPSGIYGSRTHVALARYYSKPQIVALAALANKRLAALQRVEVGIVTSHAKVFESRMQYCDAGSLAHCGLRAAWPPWPDVPRNTDCSGYVQWVYFQSGIPDPNGSGVGNTTSLYRRGTLVHPGAKLLVGDLVFYGANNSHVAIYIGHGLVSSHGEPGIKIEPYNYRLIYGIRRYF